MQTSAEARPAIAVGQSAPPVLQSIVDPLLGVLVYVALLTLDDRQPAKHDVIATVLLLVLPGAVPFRRFEWMEFRRLLKRWVFMVVLLAIVSQAVQRALDRGAPTFEPLFLANWALGTLAALLLTHLATAWGSRRLARVHTKRPVVIVGVNAVALRLGGWLASDDGVEERLLGYFDDRTASRTGLPDALVRLGGLAQVGDYVRQHRVALIYITLPMCPSRRMLELLADLQDTTASVSIVPDIFLSDVVHGRVRIVGGVPAFSVRDTPFTGVSGFLKRALDLLIVLGALPIALPLMAFIALAIRTTSRGPVIFRQRRFGLDSTEIVVWKFRTMRTLEDGDHVYRQVTRHDERVTCVGRFLRSTSLDELPQLLNVLEGTMSIVGPRPHALAVNEQFRKLIPGYMLRHKIKPGITGWAQVHGHRGGDDLDAMRKRTEFDLHYLKSWSIGLDLLIIWKTLVLLAWGDKQAY